MNVIFRAILAVRRKLARSLILLVLMILIFSALISEAVVKNSIVSLKENLNKNFRAGFTVSGWDGGLWRCKREGRQKGGCRCL